MRKIKNILAVLLSAILLTAVTVVLTGCGSKYRSLNFTAGDGYSVVFDNHDYAIKNANGDVIGKVAISNFVSSVNSSGEHSPVGVEKDTNLELRVSIADAYDAFALSVTVNGASLTGQSISAGQIVIGDEQTRCIQVNYSYEPESSEKEFNVNIGDIKAMTIGGHNWKLFGINVAAGFYGPGNLYNSMRIGVDHDYRLNFKNDGSWSGIIKEAPDSRNFSGRWAEQNGVLAASIEEPVIADWRFTLMTAAQRKALITDKEISLGISEENKALGAGVILSSEEGQIILVLDIQ